MFKKILAPLLAVFLVPGANAAQEYATKHCADFGQPEFVFSSGEGALVEADAQWLLSGLEEMVASGSRFKADETILIGPVLLKLEASQGNRLRLLEPDMKSMPFKYVDSVGRTLNIVRRQRDTAESIGATRQLSFAPLNQPLLMTRDALKAPFVLMMRHTRAGGTGWVLSNAQSSKSIAEEELQAMSVYEATLMRPEILDFLALPDAYTIVVGQRSEFTIFMDGKPVEPRKGSYLETRGK